MGRAYDPARRMRERLMRLEQQAAARTEAHAVADGVAETVALECSRGAAFEAKAGVRETAYRRQPGLEWLLRKGRLSTAQKAAGERYGDCYRRAKIGVSIPSTLEVKPETSAQGGELVSVLIAKADANARAADRLAALRARLGAQPDLVRACDLVCGEELSPREAGGGERQGLRIEAVLLVALDLLAP
jgi:hypothetical protein